MMKKTACNKQRHCGGISRAVIILAAALALTACPEAAEEDTSGTVVNVDDANVDETWKIEFNHPELYFWSTSGVVQGNTQRPKDNQADWPYHLTGDDAVIRPAANYTRRDMSAVILNPSGVKTNATVKYFVSATESGDAQTIPGIEVKDTGMIHIKSDFPFTGTEESRTFYVFAESLNTKLRTPNNQRIKIEVKKKSAVTGLEPVDYPARVDKNTQPSGLSGAWKLFYSDEFDTPASGTNGTNRGLSAGWAPYYLRSWSTDEESKTYFELENQMLYLTGHRDMRPWSTQDNYQRISGMMSMQRPFLHRWGNSPTKSREIPVFDGIATKFGYFELRAKLPNTRDGAHFAWWMVGAQDDQHPSVTNANNVAFFVNPNDSGWPYGWSNHGAEYDLLEQHMNPTAGYYPLWSRHHINNGTNAMTSYSTWNSGESTYNFFTNGKDPFNEFHTYGFEWDEYGFKYYIDDEVVVNKPSTPGANYRMLQILSLYLGKSDRNAGTFGRDRGIYPKDVVIDYFRIYKKDEPSSPHSIEITMSPYYFQVPSNGTKTFQMQAKVLDQFDKPMPDEAANIKWKLSKSVAGPQRYLFGADWSSPALTGVSINPDTGLVTVSSGAGLSQDVYVTAYHSGALNQAQFRLQRGVFETRHIKLSRDQAKARVVYFEGCPTHKVRVTPGGTLTIKPIVYDQYLNPMATSATVSIQKDITAREEIAIPGVTLNGTTLQVGSGVPVGTAIIVNAKTRSPVPFEGPLAVGGSGGKSPVVDGGLTEHVMGNLVIEVAAPAP
jgi:hypothetical protein